MRMFREYLGPHFDARRTKDGHGDTRIVTNNHINISTPPDSTHYDHITEIAKSALRPFAIKSHSESLKKNVSIRGHVYFGYVGDVIQRIMLSYPTLRWWIEADGLVVEEITAELGPISDFDRLAGGLVREHWRDDGLSQSALNLITEKLDAEGFALKENLQHAQWEPIARHNQKHSRAPIRTFRDAAENPRFVRSIRRRLYTARNRYNKALQAVKPIYVEI